MNFVANPLYIDRQMGRRFDCQPPREKGDHLVLLSEERGHMSIHGKSTRRRCSHFLHNVIRNIEVGMNFLHIVMLV